jgi:hypothetical protein
MTDPLHRFETLVDQQIRAAQERGDFDDLPGMGKPLPGWGTQDDEHWWVRGYLHREGIASEALLPTSLRLAKEIERLPETVRALPSEPAVREVVADLNRRIEEYVRVPSGPPVAIRPVDPDLMVERWRSERLPAAGGAGPAETSASRRPRRPRWRRWFTRRRWSRAGQRARRFASQASESG